MIARLRHRLRSGDGWNAVRRRTAMWIDRQCAPVAARLRPLRAVPVSADPRLAIVTVNFSTTRYLQLMLLTLSEQQGLDAVERIVVVDNGSLDGGIDFLRSLAAAAPRLHLVERSHWLHHGPAMRAGLRALDRLDAADPHAAETVLFIDADVLFLRPDALDAVAGSFVAHDAALVGEVRPGDHTCPDIQASVFAVRRAVIAHRGIAPLVHDGSPAYRMQRSIQRAGLTVVDLPTHRSGLMLHRGRAGVAAARQFRRRHAYATARQQEPHFMGVPDGEATWAATEARLAPLVDGDQAALVDLLASRFAVLGTAG